MIVGSPVFDAPMGVGPISPPSRTMNSTTVTLAWDTADASTTGSQWRLSMPGTASATSTNQLYIPAELDDGTGTGSLTLRDAQIIQWPASEQQYLRCPTTSATGWVAGTTDTSDTWCKIEVFDNDTCVTWNKRYAVQQLSPAQRMADIIRSRQAPAVHTRHRPQTPSADVREVRARETLRKIIGDDKFRSFLKSGFVSVKSKKGLVYQIFPGHGITCVYDKGQMIERLCVVLQGNFPPTDSIVVRYLLVLNHEEKLWELGIKHGPFQEKEAVERTPVRSLSDIYSDLKEGKLHPDDLGMGRPPAHKTWAA